MNIKRSTSQAPGRCRLVEHNGLIWGVAIGKGAGIEVQTADMLALVDEILAQGGSDRHHILEATIYLTDMANKDAMDKIWNAWIPADGFPCRACVGTALAGNDLIEIKFTAAKISAD